MGSHGKVATKESQKYQKNNSLSADQIQATLQSHFLYVVDPPTSEPFATTSIILKYIY